MALAYTERAGGRNVLIKRKHWEVGDTETGNGVALVFGDNESFVASLVESFNTVADLRARLAAVEAERDRLREACEEIASSRYSCLPWDELARQAIQSADAALAAPADAGKEVAGE